MVILPPPAIDQPQAAACAQAAEDEPVLCPIRLPAIRSITVERNAQQAWQDKTQPVSCRGFVMTAGRMKAFLAEVRQTDAQSVHYTLPESPCYATGRVRFADGRTGRWRVDQFRVGRLTFVGGKEMILYCPRCRFEPFSE